jgi:cell division protein ZapB
MTYSPLPEGVEIMDSELFDVLEKKIDVLLENYGALKQENARMREEVQSLREDRDRVKVRLDAIIRKMEGI